MKEDPAWHATVSCPWTWGEDGRPYVPMPLSSASTVADELDASPTSWHRVVDMIALAFAYVTHNRRSDATDLLRDCYVFTLPQPFCRHDCAIIKDYRDALRHVLDSFWAVIEWSRTQSTPPLLRTFVDTITPFAELGAPLQAAVHAMRAGICKKLQRDVALAHQTRSIDLSPEEGEWHTAMGRVLADMQSRASEPVSDLILMHLREGHRLRPGPHTGLALAGHLAATKQGHAEALRLVDEALRLYPDHPYVLSHAGHVFIQVHGVTKDAVAQAERLLVRCRAVIGDRSFLRIQLGILCRRQGGRDAEADHHFREACRLNKADAGTVELFYLQDKANLKRSKGKR